MKNFRFIIKRIFGMNHKAMLENVDRLHEKTGRSKLWLLQDMIRCTMKHGSGHIDYEQFEMYNMTDAQRATYLTRGRNNAIVKQYNDQSYNHIVHNKDEFNAHFDKYLHRDWALMREKENAIAFLSQYEDFMIKPLDGSCGVGIRKLKASSFASPEAAYEELWASDGNALLEELIIQHPDVSNIYPGSVNTIRAVTLLKDGRPHVITTCFRMGNNGNHVDNLNNGGMVVPVDEKTGHISLRAMDKEKKVYANHPVTGNPIQGFTFPDWEKAMNLVKEAALDIPQIGYMGWDIAFTPDGPVIVEGNEYPGNGLLQLPEHTPGKIGIMPKFNI